MKTSKSIKLPTGKIIPAGTELHFSREGNGFYDGDNIVFESIPEQAFEALPTVPGDTRGWCPISCPKYWPPSMKRALGDFVPEDFHLAIAVNISDITGKRADGSTYKYDTSTSGVYIYVWDTREIVHIIRDKKFCSDYVYNYQPSKKAVRVDPKPLDPLRNSAGFDNVARHVLTSLTQNNYPSTKYADCVYHRLTPATKFNLSNKKFHESPKDAQDIINKVVDQVPEMQAVFDKLGKSFVIDDMIPDKKVVGKFKSFAITSFMNVDGKFANTSIAIVEVQGETFDTRLNHLLQVITKKSI